jgi:hypothetical protein
VAGFRRRRGLRGLPVIDPTLGDPTAADVRQALEDGEWRPLAAVLHDARPRDRTWAVETLRDTRLAMPVTARWVNESPDDPLGRVTHGRVLTAWAWEARSAVEPGEPRPDTWEMVRHRMQAAEIELSTAADIAPGDAAPWRRLVWTGLGLRLPVDVLRARYEEAHRRDPYEPAAVRAFVVAASVRGAHEEALEVARVVANGAPAGNGARLAVPLAYLEQAVARTRTMPLEEAVEAVRRRSADEEIVAVAQRGPFSASFLADGAGLLEVNHFMLAFAVNGHHDEARRCAAILDGRYSAQPWARFGDPVEVIAGHLAALPPADGQDG